MPIYDRRSVMRGGGAALLSAALAACGGTTVHRPHPSPVRLANVDPWGANVFLDLEDEAWKRRHTMEMLQQAGVRWVYQRMAWGNIETTGKGSFEDLQRREHTWERYDEIVDLAEEFEIAVVARVEQTPLWARPVGSSATSPPVNLNDFADFLKTLGGRYAGRVTTYQIWHEPNLASGWGGAAPAPEAYADLLRVAYDVLKSVDSEISVASAQLAPTLETSPRALNDLLYLRQLYDKAAGEAFDIQAAAAFGMEHPPAAEPDPRVLNFRRVELVRELMVEYDLGEIPVWLSAYGWNAAPADFDASQLAWRRVPEMQQAEWTVDSVRYGLREWPWIGVFGIWFFRQAFGHLGPDDASYFFRLVDPDFTPRLVYRAVQQAATGQTDL